MPTRSILIAALFATLAACASMGGPSSSGALAPPTVNGIYIAQGACPGEGCTFGRWRATKPIDVYDAVGPAPRVLATIAAGERVEALTGEVHLRPLRGVVRRPYGETLKPGDVVYLLDYLGEGENNIWRRGEILTWTDEGGDPASSDIAWDAHGDDWTGAVWWVQVKRANETVGWLRDPRDFECSDSLAGDAGCDR